jgi:hypothetical protein
MSQDNQTLILEAPKASRRGLLLGLMAAAAVPAAPVIASAVAAPAAAPVAVAEPLRPHPDAALFKLIQDWRAARVESKRTYQAFRPFEKEEFRRRSKWESEIGAPEALRVQPGDAGLGIRKPQDGGLYSKSDVEDLKGKTWFDCDRRIEGEVTLIRLWNFIPSPQARARAEEIIAAHERWSALTAKGPRAPRGFRKAERAQIAAANREWAIEQKIQKTPAKTLEGLPEALQS